MNIADHEIRNNVADSLKMECPNCQGMLRKFKDWKIKCNLCDLEIEITTRKQRMYFWILNGSILLVALGIAIGFFWSM